MNAEKQKLLISYMISDPAVFARCNSILNTNYFDPEVRQSVGFTKSYYEQFRTLPNIDQIRVETGCAYTEKQLSKSEAEYALVEIEKFCRYKAMEHAIIGAGKLMADGDYGKVETNIRAAIAVSLNRDLGTDYFLDPEARLRNMLTHSPVIPTMYGDLDAIIEGISRKELILFMGGSGTGKSVHMSNLAINLLSQKLHGVYFTLELAEDRVAKRHDGMESGVSQKDIFEKMSKVAAELDKVKGKRGSLFIKRMPESTTTANHLRAYLKEYELATGIIPDFIVVDYMDLMASNQNVSAENLFVKDKYIAEELRAVANDLDLICISASQMNRAAVKADDIDQSNIAGGISKINTCDLLLAIIHTDQMKASGECMLKIVKSRNSDGVGKFVMLRWDVLTLKISGIGSKPDKIEFVRKDDMNNKPKKKDLLDLINV